MNRGNRGDQLNVDNPDGSEDYVVGDLVIDADTGLGSFNITVNEDDFPEGAERIGLRISDPDNNLPAGWTIDGANDDFLLWIVANDNAARFAEWPRGNPGSFAPLSAIVGEGGTANMAVLLDHIAPDGQWTAGADKRAGCV